MISIRQKRVNILQRLTMHPCYHKQVLLASISCQFTHPLHLLRGVWGLAAALLVVCPCHSQNGKHPFMRQMLES